MKVDRKIRVLQSVNSLGVGGNVVFVMNYVRAVDKSKFQVDFVIFDKRYMHYAEEAQNMGCKIHICDVRSSNFFFRLFKQMKYVYKLLKKESYDVVHAHSCSFLGIFRTVIPARLYQKSLIIGHSHNPGMPKNTFLDRIFRRIAKAVMTVCIDYGFACSKEAGASKYTERFMQSRRYKTIKNAIDIKRYRFNYKNRVAVRRQYNLSENYVVGSVGRLEEQKNYVFLIDVFVNLLQWNPLARLLLVGTGSQMELLKTKAEEYQISEQVIFAGQSFEPEKYYSAMDVFVLPSIYEGFGLVNIEAQASGLPCVISDVAPKEVDCGGRCTFLSLKSGTKVWAKQILSAQSAIDRENAYQECSEYDIYHAIKELEAYYRRKKEK